MAEHVDSSLVDATWLGGARPGLRRLADPERDPAVVRPGRADDALPRVGRGPCGPVRFVELPRISDPRGNLTFIEGGDHVPFECRRVYYLYDVPGGESRGEHAHKELEQLVIAASGSFELTVDDGFTRARISLNRSWWGVYLPPMTWRGLAEFSSGSIALVLASRHYSEDDYVRDYGEFRRLAGAA